jgi:hypothetical protein
MHREISCCVEIWQSPIAHRLGDTNTSIEAIHVSSQESFNPALLR